MLLLSLVPCMSVLSCRWQCYCLWSLCPATGAGAGAAVAIFACQCSCRFVGRALPSDGSVMQAVLLLVFVLRVAVDVVLRALFLLAFVLRAVVVVGVLVVLLIVWLCVVGDAALSVSATYRC